ncbi:MAG: O-antigen ligase family protein [Sphingomonadales bacterium]|nr:O-antigen ligase family protein [Sphingomonadales bacterium]MBD3774787.1 O-antigen ligase family protein [Paracoccaceae bacterium]
MKHTTAATDGPVVEEKGSALFIASAALMLVSLVVGGTSRPLNQLVIALAALPVLYLVLVSPKRMPLAWTAKLALALLGLALLQLVPLPPSLWTALPGRDLAAAALDGAGLSPGWRPLALDPGAAAMTLGTLFSPLVLHVAVCRLGWTDTRRLLAILAGFALVSALLGIAQRLAGGLALYTTAHAGDSIGLFTNRNHHADLIISGMLLLSALVLPGQLRRYRLVLSAALVVLALSVIATTSRFGITLAAPATLVALLVVWRPSPRQALTLGAAAVVGALALFYVPAFSAIFERFGEVGDDQRLTMARDTLVAARAMWPWGSGYGSFVPVYMAFEDLDMIQARYIVAAHNDYLQLLLEGGLAGLLTAFAGVVAVALLGWRMFTAAAPALAWGAWGVLVLLMTHSFFDFPLRTGALMAVYAVCTAATYTAGRRLPHR